MNHLPHPQRSLAFHLVAATAAAGLALAALCVLPAGHVLPVEAVRTGGGANGQAYGVLRSTSPMTTPTLVPTRTPTPAPAYLPVTLRDPSCTPEEQHLNVMFVLDGSSYMKKFHAGQLSVEIAQDILRAWLDVMQFTPNAKGQRDRAGIVVFRKNADPLPGELVGLTSDKRALRQWVDAFELGNPADRARMDTALLRARDMLVDQPKDGNKNVIVFVSEMQAKGVPYENVPGCETKNEECVVMKRAAEVKASGVTLIVNATDNANRGEELVAMASEKSLGIVRPSAEQIAGLYTRIAPRKACARNLFWPYR